MASVADNDVKSSFVGGKARKKAIPKEMEPYKWVKGQSGNPKGRPKGQTLKEYAKEYYFSMSDEEKEAYIWRVEAKRPGFVWEMAEGRATEDKNIKITAPIPILGGLTGENIQHLGHIDTSHNLGCASEDTEGGAGTPPPVPQVGEEIDK